MKKIVKDGWHEVYGYPVYVEDGKVNPYRACKYGGWDIDINMTLDALRAGLSRGIMIIS